MDRTALNGLDELLFKQWYQNRTSKLGLNPNPDDPKHYYDWRGAYLSGAEPDKEGHWPSKFKQEGHPNLYVDGRDTRVSELHDMYGLGMGMDNDPSWRPSHSLGDQIKKQHSYEQEDQTEMRLLMLLYKQYYPKMPDQEIGFKVLKHMNEMRINEAQFGLEFGRNQMNLKKNRIGY